MEGTLMASNLACVGLAVSTRDELEVLVAAIRPAAVRFGRIGGIEWLRWDDPSGARLVIGLENGVLVDFLPCFAADATTRLARVQNVNSEVTSADVVDDDGQQTTALTFELEQRRLLPDQPVESALASFVFLGRNVTVHA